MNRKFLVIASTVLALLLAYFFLQNRKKHPAPELVVQQDLPADQPKGIPLPFRSDTLSDGTIVFLMDSISFVQTPEFSKKRTILVDGQVFFKTGPVPSELFIRTRLMQMRITKPSEFMIGAYSKDEGEDIHVLSGNIIVKKTYPSPYSDPDTLVNDQLYMINRQIDLTEKEKLDTKELRAWWEKVK